MQPAKTAVLLRPRPEWRETPLGPEAKKDGKLEREQNNISTDPLLRQFFCLVFLLSLQFAPGQNAEKKLSTGTLATLEKNTG